MVTPESAQTTKRCQAALPLHWGLQCLLATAVEASEKVHEAAAPHGPEESPVEPRVAA